MSLFASVLLPSPANSHEYLSCVDEVKPLLEMESVEAEHCLFYQQSAPLGPVSNLSKLFSAVRTDLWWILYLCRYSGTDQRPPLRDS